MTRGIRELLLGDKNFGKHFLRFISIVFGKYAIIAFTSNSFLLLLHFFWKIWRLLRRVRDIAPKEFPRGTTQISIKALICMCWVQDKVLATVLSTISCRSTLAKPSRRWTGSDCRTKP